MKDKHKGQLFDVPASLKASKLLADPIEEMVGALTDPLIVFPGGGWEHDIPQRIRDELPIRRLAHLMLCLKGEAASDEVCDLEALAYLYPASMVAPMPSDWFHIYMYLGTRCFSSIFPEDIKQDNLNDYEMSELRGLKRWIRRKKLEARKARRKSQRPQEQETPAQAKTEMVQIAFDFTKEQALT